jgi:hypothetical protein
MLRGRLADGLGVEGELHAAIPAAAAGCVTVRTFYEWVIRLHSIALPDLYKKRGVAEVGIC